MGKALKITAIISGAFLALLILGALLVPLVFKDRIVDWMRTELNSRLEATLEFADVDVSFLSTFPLLSVKIDRVNILGTAEFEGQELFSANAIEVGADVFALLGDQIQVERLLIEEPAAHLIVTQAGTTNYEIFKSTEAEGDVGEGAKSDKIDFRLEKYTVVDGTLTYRTPDTVVTVGGLDLEGKVGLSESIQKWALRTTAESVTASISGLRVLKEAEIEISLDATVESKAQRLQIDEANVRINELPVAVKGSVTSAEEGFMLDLTLSSENDSSIKDLVSALPDAYAANFKKLEAGGSFSLGATIKGQLGPEDQDIPAFEAHALVTHGRFKYPDMPLEIRNIELDAKVIHPGGSLNKMQIRIRKYGFTAGKSEASGSLLASSPLSVPNIELTLKSRIDLAEIAAAYPRPSGEARKGQLTADVDVAARGTDISKLTGRVEARGVELRGKDKPAVQVQTMLLALSPKATTIEELRVATGSSDASISGSLSPITSLLLPNETVKGVLSLRSRQINVDDFSTGSSSSSNEVPFKIPANVDVLVNTDIERATYDKLVLRNVKGQLRVKDGAVTFKNMRSDALGGSLGVEGVVRTPEGEEPSFDMSYSLEKAQFGEAFKALGTLQTLAPIIDSLTGRFTTTVAVRGKLDDGLVPQIRSLGGAGFVEAFGSTLKDFKPLTALSAAVPVIPDSLSFNDVKARFSIEEGGVKVNEFPIKTKYLTLLVGGRHGLDQQMKYSVKTEIPAQQLRATTFAKKAEGLGLDLTKATTIRIRAEVTGSLKEPRVTFNADASDVVQAVKEAVVARVEEETQKLKDEASKQAQQLIDQAKKQSEQIRKQARASADRARKEGYARADQLEREGGNNPLKQVAAKQGAKALRSETDKAVNKILAEADKRADDLIRKAEQQAQELTR